MLCFKNTSGKDNSTKCGEKEDVEGRRLETRHFQLNFDRPLLFVPQPTYAGAGGREGIASTHHDFGTRWGEWAASRPRPCFTPRERAPRYSLYRRLGGPQSRSGHRG
jgi:hypothetical protein